MLMLYVKLIVFITQHQDITCSAKLYKGQWILNLSGTTHFSHVQMDHIGSCHYFTLPLATNKCAMGFTDTNMRTPTSRSSSSLSYHQPEILKILKEYWNETHHPKHEWQFN